MTHEEAFRWLEAVDASIFQDEDEPQGDTWIAVVKAPGNGAGNPEHVILVTGETFLQATAEAEAQWSAHWSTIRHWH